MNTIVLNILNKKQNLSYSLIFAKIGKYYWNEIQAYVNYFNTQYHNMTQKQFIQYAFRVCAENNYYKIMDLMEVNELLFLASENNKFDIVKRYVKSPDFSIKKIINISKHSYQYLGYF